jgi:hypothetical protein
MKYVKDEYGQKALLNENDFQVMMEWEKPYMEACIQNLNPNGHVLEIGFGMGYSANEIQKYDIESYTIIEADPVVLEKLHEWAKLQKHKIIIIAGAWQDKLKDLGKYDSIFLDDAIHEAYKDKTTLRFYQFYKELAQRHVNPGARFAWYMDRNLPISVDADLSFECTDFISDIPEHARYIPEDTHTSKLLYMPVITFKKGSKEDITVIGIDFSGIPSTVQ